MCLRTFDLVTLLITTLLHKCWITPLNTIPLSSESFNIMQQGTKTLLRCRIQHCWMVLNENVESVLPRPNCYFELCLCRTDPVLLTAFSHSTDDRITSLQANIKVWLEKTLSICWCDDTSKICKFFCFRVTAWIRFFFNE